MTVWSGGREGGKEAYLIDDDLVGDKSGGGHFPPGPLAGGRETNMGVGGGEAPEAGGGEGRQGGGGRWVDARVVG